MEFFREKALSLQTLKQITTLITEYQNILNVLIEFKIMKKSNSKQLCRIQPVQCFTEINNNNNNNSICIAT